MRVLHFDCFSGISGDMAVAALADAGADREGIIAAVHGLGLPVHVSFESVRKGGLAATRFRVEAEPEHKHRHLHHIEKILAAGSLTHPQRELAMRMFRRLAEAEAAVHGVGIEKVHFHEVGAADSIADFVGAAVGFLSLDVQRASARSVPTGFGTVRCEHGVMPVPAPATAHLLRGIPLARSGIEAELTTPTGAAILAELVNEWTDSPAMAIDRIGVGAGTRDIPEQPNVLRVFVGPAAVRSSADTVCVLETNLDDVPGEVIGYAQERLFHAGALDVYVIPLMMKKSRPGVLLGVIAPPDAVPAIEDVLFRETGTLGVRRSVVERTVLPRESVTIDTPWGPVRAKRSSRAGAAAVSPEFEDCAAIARDRRMPLLEVLAAVRSLIDGRTSHQP